MQEVGLQGPDIGGPHITQHPTKKTTNPSRQPGMFGSIFREATLFSMGKFFDRIEMATKVGATLASSKLAVTQDDLHLVGSSVDHLIVQFDQIAFDEFLAADQIKVSKKHRLE